MSTQKLFLEQRTEDFVRLGNALSAQYRFDGKTLSVRWGQTEKEFPAKIGDMFFVSCKGGFPDLFIPALPRSDGNLLMWLCGFYVADRFADHTTFKKFLKARKLAHSWQGYQEVRVRKAGEYDLVVYRNPHLGDACRMAAWIADGLLAEREKVVEIMRKAKKNDFLCFPDPYVQKVLRERFNLDAGQLARTGIEF